MHGEADRYALLGGCRAAADPAENLRELALVRVGRKLRHAAEAGGGEVGGRRAPGLVVVVVLVDRRHTEQHRRDESQRGGQHPHRHLPRHRHAPEQGAERPHQHKEQPRTLRLQPQPPSS